MKWHNAKDFRPLPEEIVLILTSKNVIFTGTIYDDAWHIVGTEDEMSTDTIIRDPNFVTYWARFPETPYLREPFDIQKIPENIWEMCHAIGLDYESPQELNGKLVYKPFRNRWSTPTNCSSYERWATLESRGFAVKEKFDYGTGFHYRFHLTRKGLDYLGNKIGVEIHSEEVF